MVIFNHCQTGPFSVDVYLPSKLVIRLVGKSLGHSQNIICSTPKFYPDPCKHFDTMIRKKKTRCERELLGGGLRFLIAFLVYFFPIIPGVGPDRQQPSKEDFKLCSFTG